MKKKRLISILSNLSLVFLSVISSLLFVRNFCFSAFIVQGASMEPTLKSGYYGYAECTTYAKEHIERFNIVIFKDDDEKGQQINLIKRVIALPGETLEFRDDNCDLYINDEFIPQEFISSKMQRKTCEGSTCVIEKNIVYKIPQNQYFVLGDNRGDSIDSAHGLGLVNYDKIEGVLSVITAKYDGTKKEMMPFIYF